jgi:hypothetical protein
VLGATIEKELGVRLMVAGWRHIAIGIAIRYLIWASKTWETATEDIDEEFAKGDNEEELELDTFRHIMVR